MVRWLQTLDKSIETEDYSALESLLSPAGWPLPGSKHQLSIFLCDPPECAETQGQPGRHQETTAARSQRKMTSDDIFSTTSHVIFKFRHSTV